MNLFNQWTCFYFALLLFNASVVLEAQTGILVRLDIWPLDRYLKIHVKMDGFAFQYKVRKNTVFNANVHILSLCWLAPHLSSSFCSFNVAAHAHINISFPLYNVLMPILTSLFFFLCGGGCVSVLMTYWTISRYTQLTFFWESNMTLIGFWNKSIFLVDIRGIYDLFCFYKKKNPYDGSSFYLFFIDW